MPRKKKSKVYFGKDVQEAIIRYNDTESSHKKSKIYEKEIHYAFSKLSENIINTFKFSYFDDHLDDVKKEVVSFLVMNMHKYDHTKGSKAFSYFSVVAKNYLILHNNSNYKKYKKTDSIDVLNNLDTNYFAQTKNQKMKEFIDELSIYLDRNIPVLFKKKQDIKIAYAILEILNKRNDIENFNKKWIYLLIREMTDVKTTDITKVANVLRKHYKILFEKYHTEGEINVETKKNFF